MLSPLNVIAAFVLGCWLILAFPTHAIGEDYSARIAVSDRSEAALGEAAATALAAVLVRVSGDENVPNLPAAAAMVSDARNRMSLYSYEETPDGLELLAQFDVNLIKSVLRQSGATFWSESRPPVLLWMVVDEPYSRRFATISEDGELIRELSARFADRGVSLRLPLLDLQDAAALTPEMVWQKVTSRILRASERYGTQHVLVGRYVQLTSGQQIADWLYFDQDDRDSMQIQGSNAGPILAGAVDMVVDAMAAQYAVKLEPVSVFDRLAVSVTGVETFSDYRGVLRVFEDISVVDRVQVSEVDGNRLSLRVSGVGTAAALAKLLPQQSRLAVDSVQQGSDLHLRWGQP